ncbi:hypothetical protein Droror1_Dr00000149, partial [Drosera rotundifolia]
MGGHSERTKDTMTWPRENEIAFIGMIYERLKKAKLQCSTFTKDEWGKINEELKAATSWDYGIERLKGKWNRQCIAHRLFTSLIEHTGVTWDPNTNEVHAAEEVWNHFYTCFFDGITISIVLWASLLLPDGFGAAASSVTFQGGFPSSTIGSAGKASGAFGGSWKLFCEGSSVFEEGDYGWGFVWGERCCFAEVVWDLEDSTQKNPAQS